MDELKTVMPERRISSFSNIAYQPECTEEEIETRKIHDTTLLNPVRLGRGQNNSKYPQPLRVTVDNEKKTQW